MTGYIGYNFQVPDTLSASSVLHYFYVVQRIVRCLSLTYKRIK